MEADEALALLDELLPNHSLTNLQETVFSQVWEGKTYAEIAEDCSYEHNYIRDVGFRLWQMLSETLNQKISKSNIRAVLRRYARNRDANRSAGNFIANNTPVILEFPSGPVPLHSQLYVERPPIEERAFSEVLKPGSLVRIKAPRLMGKTSLLRRVVVHGQAHQLRSVSLRFNRADRTIYQNLDAFLRWFCANISYQLQIEPNLDTYWNPAIGSKVSCSAYLEDYVLGQVEGDIVIALDEMSALFQYPEISSEFLPLLRTWYEDAREFNSWQRIRWVLAHATDVYVPLKLNQSPFNVGLPIKLPSFSLEQVQELASRHGINWAEKDANKASLLSLLHMVSCRPGLVRLALYALARYDITLAQLIEEAPTQSGIYSDHLRELLAALYLHTDLQTAFQIVVRSPHPVTLEPITAYRLESLGLITLNKNQASPACELYQRYFYDFLPTEPSSSYV
ncbi:AAA-like domain-containing protein [Oscillatoria sp. CS-180]|uniref:AAA-like domain-containing protein n=1 Tax=Oscillatoria sp. CS-180 TaxID=3021720 RepID=UPI00232D6B19|nr:AAA-like domain-containing protein [Oscillatoria sp. CS-180]MDB9525793.1 AAA-like domain-containing protein [Oscillatoria sp. CS-180]